MIAIDATCPLVTKVHREVERHHAAGQQIILVGHAGHPEVVGTMGQAEPGSVVLVEDLAGVSTAVVSDADQLAFVTQTTLSVDDTTEIVDALKARFPSIAGPRREDICYATTNRQEAVKAIASRCDTLIVIGAPNSSNSRRLVEVAIRAGIARAFLVQRAAEIDWDQLAGMKRLGITAGASAPELLVDELIAACRARFTVKIESLTVTVEDTVFQLPSELRTEPA
jgi:4-hydroxy-3-methylbut-2-enyl diphosphate reductase